MQIWEGSEYFVCSKYLLIFNKYSFLNLPRYWCPSHLKPPILQMSGRSKYANEAGKLSFLVRPCHILRQKYNGGKSAQICISRNFKIYTSRECKMCISLPNLGTVSWEVSIKDENVAPVLKPGSGLSQQKYLLNIFQSFMEQLNKIRLKRISESGVSADGGLQDRSAGWPEGHQHWHQRSCISAFSKIKHF